MNVTISDLYALLGEKDVIIFQLQKKVNTLTEELAKLKEPKVPE